MKLVKQKPAKQRSPEGNEASKSLLMYKQFTSVNKLQKIPKLYFQTQASVNPEFIIPENIKYDKQTMYFEILKLRKQIHQLSKQNLQTKSKLKFYQKEFARIEDQYYDKNQNFDKSQRLRNAQRTNHLLKQQIRLKNCQFQQLMNDYNRLKTSVKKCKISELQAQVINFMDECQRLKNYINELQQSKRIEVEYLNEKLKKQKQYILRIQNDMKPSTFKRLQPLKQRTEESKIVKKNKSYSLQKIKYNKTNNLIRRQDLDIPYEPQINESTLSENEVANSVQDIVEFSIYKLKAYNISYEALIDQIRQQRISNLKQLTRLIEEKPFSITSQKDISKLLKHINKNKKQLDIPTYFISLFPKYNLINQQKVSEIQFVITSIIKQWAKQIEQMMSQYKDDSNFMDKQIIIDFLTKMDLKQTEIDYVLTKICLTSLDIHHWNYKQIFQSFSVQ